LAFAWRAVGILLEFFTGGVLWQAGGDPMLGIAASVCITVPGLWQGNF